MASYPRDQFDDLPDDLLRVGAHRGPAPKGRGWMAFGWASLATIVLVVGGIYGLSRFDASYSFELPFGGETQAPESTDAPEETVTPITDPSTIVDREIDVTVLNGTTTPGLQTNAATVLQEALWTVGLVANASANDITESVVYYDTAENEDVALGVAQALGVTTVRLSDAFPGAKITVVLGSDFAGAEAPADDATEAPEG